MNRHAVRAADLHGLTFTKGTKDNASGNVVGGGQMFGIGGGHYARAVAGHSLDFLTAINLGLEKLSPKVACTSIRSESGGSPYEESMVRTWIRMQRQRISSSSSVGRDVLSEETKDEER